VRAVEVAEVAGELTAHALLDVRDEEAFRRGHLSGSGHLPLAELAERRSELPPRDAKLLVVGADGAQAHDAAQALEALGYSQVVWLDAPAQHCASGLLDAAPAVPLWRPSPFLEHVRSRLPDPSRLACRVLDLAAGAGRESVWMALQGYAVDAWDHDRGALDKAAALARRHGVAISTEVRNLEIRDPRLPIEAHDVVMVFRFLHRPLFPQIARAVALGGWVVYETYLRGQERFGRPKHPRFLLDSGELPRHFPGFEVVDYQELTPESGPMLARLLARKTGPSSDPRLAP
jgi:rhodanese-related sulfurtransferase